MRALAVVALGLALNACQPPTPAQEAIGARIAIDAGRVACFKAQRQSLAITPEQAEWCACKK